MIYKIIIYNFRKIILLFFENKIRITVQITVIRMKTRQIDLYVM